MIISILIIAIITVGGAALTYLFSRDEGILWRLAAGNIVGSLLFFFPAFIVFSAGVCLFSAAPYIAVISLAIAASPVLLLRGHDIRERFRHEKDLARGKVQGATYSKILRFGYYAFFLILFFFFFGRAMVATPDGIYTGASQNLGDLPYHLGAIFSFSEACNHSLQNPSFSGATFTYPFVADFLTAIHVSLGSKVENAMFWQNFAWALSLLVLLERFVLKITKDRVASRIGPILLFFSGGLGFVWFFSEYSGGTVGLWEMIWNLPKDYTIGDEFRWGNSLVVLFITQRSLLLGLPLALIVLGFLWQRFFAGETAPSRSKKSGFLGLPAKTALPLLIVGFLAGTLPFVHAHSLAVLFVVSAFWFFFSVDRWKEWIIFGAGVAVIAVPELLWLMSGSASRTTEFVGWHFGFDSGETNIFWFWLKNTGLFIPLLIAGLAVLLSHRGQDEEDDEEQRSESAMRSVGAKIVVFYLPFLFLFVVSNLLKLAPWQWDNIKVLIFWFVGSIPIVALFLAWLWRKGPAFKGLAVVFLLGLVLSGAIDVFRTASGQIRNRVFDRQAADLGRWARFYTEPGDIFLNAPTYNSAVVMSGRISVMRYIGHLSSHGIDYAEREAEVKRIYAGGPDADDLLKKHKVKYILVSPAEFSGLQVNGTYLSRFPVAHQEGQYRLLRVE